MAKLKGKTGDMKKAKMWMVQTQKNNELVSSRSLEIAYRKKYKTIFDSYNSNMTDIRSKLQIAMQGLEQMNIKGLNDQISEAIDAVMLIRNNQIDEENKYIKQLAEIDTNRVKELCQNGGIQDKFIIKTFESKIKAEHDAFQKRLKDNESKDKELQTQLKDENISTSEKVELQRQRDDLLSSKYHECRNYARFLRDVAAERDDILHGISYEESVQNTKTKQEEIIQNTEQIENAFETATQNVGSKWQAFKSMPVVAGLLKGSRTVASKAKAKLSPYFEAAKGDFMAGYAAMKENRQTRRIEKDLVRYDKLMNNQGEDSFLAKFKSTLKENKDNSDEALETEGHMSVPDIPIAAESESEAEASEVHDVAPETVVEPETVEQIHDKRIRTAENAAVLHAVENTGLRKFINDYCWSDINETHDIMNKLQSSDNVIDDLTQYTSRLESMIEHFPNQKLQASLKEKLQTSMTEVYHEKAEAAKKVSAAEARIRDSEEFLKNLDINPQGIQHDLS